MVKTKVLLQVAPNNHKIGYGNRVRMQQLQQREWIDQQAREKQDIENRRKQDQKQYDEQTKYFNQKLKEEQDNHEAQRKAMYKAMQEENL